MPLRHPLRNRVLPLIFALLVTAAAAAVRYDMPKEELLKELGKPVSIMKSPSGREVLNYPKGVRIELEKGLVVSVKGLDLAAAETAPEAVEEKPAAEPEHAAAPAKPAAAPAVARVDNKPETAAETAARVTMEQAVAAMEKREAHQAAKDEKDYARVAAVFSITTFFIKLFISWAVMVVALKLTTKYWSVDVDWSGILLAAAAESGTRAVIGLVGEYVFHTTSLYYLDQITATIVLIFVLRKVSTNQSMNQAVSIALGSRLFTLLVNLMLFTLLLNVLH